MGFTGVSVNAHKGSIQTTPTALDNLDYVSVLNGVFDELYMHQSSEDLTEIPDSWDWTTVMYASFTGTLTAGNIGYTLSQINAARIKRRRQGGDWITLFEVPVAVEDDLIFTLYDPYAAAGITYEYAMVPVIDSAESSIVSIEVVPEFDGVCITDGKTSFHTIAEAKIESYERKRSNVMVSTLTGKYPYYIRNDATDYDSGDAQGMFLPKLADGCTLTLNGAQSYRKQVNDFLSSERAKVLKDGSGQAWMIQVNGNISNNMQGNPYLMLTKFTWIEIGDLDSQSDLYDNGLISVAPHMSGV